LTLQTDRHSQKKIFLYQRPRPEQGRITYWSVFVSNVKNTN